WEIIERTTDDMILFTDFFVSKKAAYEAAAEAAEKAVKSADPAIFINTVKPAMYIIEESAPLMRKAGESPLSALKKLFAGRWYDGATNTWKHGILTNLHIHLRKIAHWPSGKTLLIICGLVVTFIGLDYGIIWAYKEMVLDPPSFNLWSIKGMKPVDRVAGLTQLRMLKANIIDAEPNMLLLSYLNPFFITMVPIYLENARRTHDMYADIFGVPEEKFYLTEYTLGETVSGEVVAVVDGNNLTVNVKVDNVPEVGATSVEESTAFEANSGVLLKGGTFVKGDLPLSVRVMGVYTPLGYAHGYLIKRNPVVADDCASAEATSWSVLSTMYNEIRAWLISQLLNNTVIIYGDAAKLYSFDSDYNGVIFKGAVNICRKELELGYGAVYFCSANKQVNVTNFLASEKIAKDAGLGIWAADCVKPTGAISSSPVDVYVGTEVQFTDSSVAEGGFAIVAWAWSFGGGVTSTLKNPKHTYTTEGSKAVNLRVTNSCGLFDDAPQKTITVKPPVCPKPAANFSYAPTIVYVNVEVGFTDSSMPGEGATIVTWAWNFGDGATSTLKNPKHTYTTAGSVTAKLVVKNSCGETSFEASKNITVNPPVCTKPAASFSSSPIDVYVGTEVTFTDTSTAVDGFAITKWLWTFGDGSTSASQSPKHTYTTEGSMAVNLRVTNSCLAFDDAPQKTLTVKPVVCIKPTASIAYSPSTVYVNTEVQFTDSSTAGGDASMVSWAWNFGDGTTSTLKNPKHTYIKTGSVTVKLTVTNSCGETSYEASKNITVNPPVCTRPTASLSYIPDIVYKNTKVLFIDSSIAEGGKAITSWAWNFGDM
ncbi:MAG: PKD domain-containing protein, partial [Methylococcales bacterium]|nr:PKD domain-containing protein [Methylococcales bacterium]